MTDAAIVAEDDSSDAERSRRPTTDAIPVMSQAARDAQELAVKAAEDAKIIETKPATSQNTGAPVRCAIMRVGEPTEQDLKDEAFLNAVSSKDVDAIKKALDYKPYGQEVNIAKEDGTTAVHLAAWHGDKETLELLLAQKPNVMYANRAGDLAITVAMREGHTQAFTMLLDTGLIDMKYVNKNTGFNLLHEVTWVDNLEIARLLLETGSFQGRMEEVNGKGHAAIHLAAFRATPEFCELLNEHGADPTAKQQTLRWQAMDPAEVADSHGKPESAALLRGFSVALDAVKFGTRLKMGASKKKLE